MFRLLILALLVAGSAFAGPPTTCRQEDDYSRALCAYQRRSFAEAESRFRQVAAAEEPSARSLRATYFLARTQMKLGKFDEAEVLLIRIYSLDRAFYKAWSCDFLLGECRRATGKG